MKKVEYNELKNTFCLQMGMLRQFGNFRMIFWTVILFKLYIGNQC